jgi:hypothetical protein
MEDLQSNNAKHLGQKNNSERLLTHLEEDSLAARLVQSYCRRDPAKPIESMKAVLQERIQQVRDTIDRHKD